MKKYKKAADKVRSYNTKIILLITLLSYLFVYEYVVRTGKKEIRFLQNFNI